MNLSLSYKNWFEHLQVLSPQEGVVYVGAGTGMSLSAYINNSVKSVVLIEAESASSSIISAGMPCNFN